MIFEVDRVHDYDRATNRAQGEAIARGACSVLGKTYQPQGTDDPNDGNPQRHYDVAVVWEFDEERPPEERTADQGPTWMLGADNLYYVAERAELDVIDVDYAIAVGWHAHEIVDQVGDGIAIAGATRYETWGRVLEMIQQYTDGPNPERARPWAA